MDRVGTYRHIIQKLLSERAQRSQQNSDRVEAQTIFDVERDHYQLVYVGWTRTGLRDYGCLLHI